LLKQLQIFPMTSTPSILHLCYDEKWMRGGIELFEAAFPGNNKFLVTKLSGGTRRLKYLPDDNPAIHVHEDKVSFNEWVDKEVAQAKVVVIHGIDYERRNIIKRSKDIDKFIWLIKGADMYQNPFVWDRPILGSKTAQLNKKLVNPTLTLRQKVKKKLEQLGINSLPGWKDSKLLTKESMKHLKLVGTWQKVQFDFLRDNGIISGDTDFLHFTYYPLETMVKEVEKIQELGPNILLGNSASYSNNHIEALEVLSKFKLDGRKVIAPLNYGDNLYATEISKIGQQLLGDHFEPVLEWMQLEDYNEILKSCSTIVMNHNRGQAAGNVISTLYMGCKVYLSEKNLIFAHLKSKGCKVYSIEKDLQPSNKQAFVPLSRDEVEANRSILRKELSKEVLLKSLEKKLGHLL